MAGRLQAGDRLTLIAEDDWYPYSALRDGRPQGYAVDLVRAAYAAVGVEVNFVSMPYARCMQRVRDGLDVGCFDSLKDPTTEPGSLFPQQPLFFAEIGIYARADHADNVAVRDLEGHRVGLTNGYTYGDEIERDQLIVKDIALRDELTLRKLVAGRVEYALVYTKVVDYLVSEHPDLFAGRIRQVGSVRYLPLYVNFSQRDPDGARALQLFDEGMRRIHADGRYAEIEARWRKPPL